MNLALLLLLLGVAGIVVGLLVASLKVLWIIGIVFVVVALVLYLFGPAGRYSNRL